MNRTDIQLLLDYNRWANAQMLGAVSVLNTEQFNRDLSTSHRSVHGTLTHILAAELIWLERCKGVSPKVLLASKDYPTMQSLKDKWAIVEEEQKIFLDKLDEESLSKNISYTNTIGECWEYPLYQILQQIVIHSSYHRGQITNMLRQLGANTILTDFLAYLDTNPDSI